MAKTKQEWFDTIKYWVPEWFFERSEYSEALFYAMAELLSVQEAETQDLIEQTYLDTADGDYLDLHGDERGVPRVTDELDASYASRIKNKSLVSQLSKPALQAIVNQLLVKGVCAIREDFAGDVFFGRSAFFNRGEIVLDPIDNTFTIVVDKQIHAPYSFFNREHFINRGDYFGTSVSNETVFQLILAAVNDNKAFGVLYRIIERFQ